MSINDALFVLMRRTRPDAAINNWLRYRHEECLCMPSMLYLNPDQTQFLVALQNQFPHYSADEAKYLFKYINSAEMHNGFGVFGLIANSVKNYLITDSRSECLCKYKSLIKYRELTYQIDPTIFTAAFLAKHDIDNCFDRTVFSWPVIMRSNNIRLHHILDKGMAENHFHIGGSSDSFIFSWICLMNHFTICRKSEFAEAQMDKNPLDTVFMGSNSDNSCFSLTFKAVCIRLFLFKLLNNSLSASEHDESSASEDNDSSRSDRNESQASKHNDSSKSDHHNNDAKFVDEFWLERMLSLPEEECDIHCSEVDAMLSAMRADCIPVDESGFIPDYAMYNEPLAPMDDNDLSEIYNEAIRNYERRLFRTISGEQRFQYFLFKSIYEKDPRIQPHLELAYAYLLIYCQIRGELMQINNRVGFSNFLQYQDRKSIFTRNWVSYDNMRTAIALRLVLQNPQIVSFEGRLIPAVTSQGMIDKIKGLLYLSKGADGIQGRDSDVSKKLSFVLHFAKNSQDISKSEEKELLNPRDYKCRERNMKMADAIIKANITDSESMQYVTAIDACSNEINCRPEVFAPAFRKIRNFRWNQTYECSKKPLRVPRITYHVGEDFLDLIDGLRAIDEAVKYCELQTGDRLGHALALGIDCEKWYEFKRNSIILRKQDHLDNMVWLYGKMHQYGYYNSGAEDYIAKQFKKYFTEIYTSNLDKSLKVSQLHSVDIMDYYASFGLRGNEPTLYFNNPEVNDETLNKVREAEHGEDSWKIGSGRGSNYDPLSMALYHYYHFNYNMKKVANEPMHYCITKEIINAVCVVQEKMMYDIALKNIGIECNPSSNYLIGTFKDYIKHPIFTFNNKELYPRANPKSAERNPYISVSINTDDLGIFGTSLENEYALMACALETNNDFCRDEMVVPPDNIYKWLNEVRKNGCDQSFMHINY